MLELNWSAISQLVATPNLQLIGIALFLNLLVFVVFFNVVADGFELVFDGL